jgi:transcription antitermination factor NusA-like protein
MIHVPNQAIGAIIGQGGGKVKRLAKKFNCRINILKAETDDRGLTPIYIKSYTYNKADVLSVVEEIQADVSNNVN